MENPYISALNTTRNLSNTHKKTNKSMKKWLVVFELTMQGDDIAVVYFSEKLRSQITGLSKAYKNTQDSISLLQTAEGSLSAVNDMLTKERELAIQTANDTNTENDRSQLQKNMNNY